MVVKKEEKIEEKAKFRYQCHGCTKDVGVFDKAEVGKSVTCPHCGMSQNTKEENYIIL